MTENPWLRIGWRNLGRHRKRTVLTALGLAVGYSAVVFIIGYAEGLMAEMVENATGLMSGQIEIHDAEYRPERSLYDTIGGRDGTDVARAARRDRGRCRSRRGGATRLRRRACQLRRVDVGRHTDGH